MIKLTECGAVEGQPADNALRTALDHVANGTESTIFWDGRFKITERTDKNFHPLKGKHLNIIGDGARSQILPSFPANMQSLVLGNLESFTIKDLVIAGDSTKEFDCGTLFWIGTTKKVVWDNVHIYGLASASNNPFGIVFIENCNFNMSSSMINGSTSVGSGLFTLRQIWKVGIKNVDFIDYGQLDGGTGDFGTYRSKTSLGFTHSWIKFIEPHPAGTTSYLGTPLLEQMTLDEGAQYAISCDGGTGWMRGLRLRDVGFNVRHSGILLNKIESVVIEDSYFTWQMNPCLAIEGTNVKRTRLVRCHADKNATDITLQGRVDKITLDECYGFDKVLVPENTVFRTER